MMDEKPEKKPLLHTLNLRNSLLESSQKFGLQNKLIPSHTVKQNVELLNEPRAPQFNTDFLLKHKTPIKKLGSPKPKLFDKNLSTCKPHFEIKKRKTELAIKPPKPNLYSDMKLYGISLENTFLKHKSLTPEKTQHCRDLPKSFLAEETSRKKREKKETKERRQKRAHEKVDDQTHFYEYELSLDEHQMLEELEVLRKKMKPDDDFLEKPDLNKKLKEELMELNRRKIGLINIVSIALLRSPSLEQSTDPTRKTLMKELRELAHYDGEFVLKLGLYTRQHLNIRIVANFIMAYAAYLPETRPFLKKYFGKSVVLPSDWIAVAEIYRTFFDKNINFGSLPTALRKAMTMKFPDFDEYQLAKYNKESAGKKTLVLMRDNSLDSDSASIEGESVDGDICEVRSFSLKQLIRKLHISEPVYHVMCLIGKKYPEDLNAFYQSRLPGTFDEEKAGKRMKLPVPETWETQVSLKGNIASTWEKLIDHNKLPFMAMLRNLRNMILSGMNMKYHLKIMKKLTNERAVINSKQFPFRFLSAFEVLDELEGMLGKTSEELSQAAGVARGRGRGRGGGRGRGKKRSALDSVPLNTYNKSILQQYKKALNTALKISTVHNIPPIAGTTVVLIQLSEDVANHILANDKTFKRKRKVIEMCLLLGLMCNYHCEDAIFILHDNEENKYLVVDSLDDELILENIEILTEKFNSVFYGSSAQVDINQFFHHYLAQRKKVSSF